MLKGSGGEETGKVDGVSELKGITELGLKLKNKIVYGY